MELQLEKLTFDTHIEISNGDLLHVYTLTGEFGSVDALMMKNEWQDIGPRQMLIDLTKVEKIDLIGINALVVAHRKHEMTVILPLSESAQQAFGLTKFDTIFNIKNHEYTNVEAFYA